MPIIPEMPIMSEIPIIPPRKMEESDRSEKELEDSEGNGEIRKRGGRVFDEKRLLDGYG